MCKYETPQTSFHLSFNTLLLWMLSRCLYGSPWLTRVTVSGNINCTSGLMKPRMVPIKGHFSGKTGDCFWVELCVLSQASLLGDRSGGESVGVLNLPLHCEWSTAGFKGRKPCPWVCQRERSRVLYQLEVLLVVGHCSLGHPGKHFVLLELAHQPEPKCPKR